jgi:hypothetical protein
MMRIRTYNLDGVPGPEADLVCDDHGELRLNELSVLAVGLWGKKVALSVIGRLILIDLLAYGQLTKYGRLSELE